MSSPNIHTSFGPILIGALFTSGFVSSALDPRRLVLTDLACSLAGVSNLQALHYYRAYGKDPARIKVLVSFPADIDTPLLLSLRSRFS
jgi:hypothetical protein